MKHFSLFLLVLATLLPAIRAADAPPDAARRAKARIEALLGNRRGAAATPANPVNPFVLPQSVPTAQETPAPAGDIPLTKSDNLTRLALALNVSGYIQINGVPHLIINRQTYRANDLIPVREANGSVSFLLLKAITGGEFTLELDGVELQQKHTVK